MSDHESYDPEAARAIGGLVLAAGFLAWERPWEPDPPDLAERTEQFVGRSARTGAWTTDAWPVEIRVWGSGRPTGQSLRSCTLRTVWSLPLHSTSRARARVGSTFLTRLGSFVVRQIRPAVSTASASDSAA